VEIDKTQLGSSGTVYTFEAIADDGFTTVADTFTLEITSSVLFSGTVLYTTDNNGTIHQWDLGTEYDISTRSNEQTTSLSLSDSLNCLYWKPDGSAFWIFSVPDVQNAQKYSVSTNWDITTKSFANGDPLDSSGVKGGAWFKNDGTKLFLVDASDGEIQEWLLSTAWDITTSTLETESNLSGLLSPSGLVFNKSGDKFLACDTYSGDIHEYSLTTAWDLSGGFSEQNTLTPNSANDPLGIMVGNEGVKLYIQTTAEIEEWDLSIAYDLSTASYLQNIAVSSEDVFLAG
jgi:sugar lactone lactonase YvrE